MNYESSNNNDGGGDLNKDQPPPLINIKWGDLLLNPNPDNILAVGLTGLLTWASVQLLWQLFFISLAILVAALNVGSLSSRLGVLLRFAEIRNSKLRIPIAELPFHKLK
ncbi:hypothetical protein NC652_020220 [Populus alba x Populus x berolinensis]|uniref:Uncharacterized protein n=1 Tax=Populus tomentosa TaxID=118781 RepID=A0A8X8CJE4_POPTO|nr:hypothetical protein POTOM_029143 [Populus tomentosa]KAJ6909174.1 hypothetical protein NC652_020220 [Populus alba x Populus x berolinensis]